MQTSTCKSRTAITCVVATILLAANSVESMAQQPVPITNVGANENIFQVLNPRNELQLVEQFSRVFESPNRIIRVDGFDPEILTVSALTPNRIRVHAESTGVTTLIITDEFDNSYSVEIFVDGDVRHLQAYLRRLFPEDDIEAVKVAKDSIVLRGVVTEPDHITQIVDVAEEFATNVLNQMSVGGVHQVQLNTKIMEVQRTKIRQLGFNFLLNSQGTYASSTPGSIVGVDGLTTPIGGPSGVDFAGLSGSTVQFAVMGASEVFNGFVDALRNENLLKILAEPKLVTTSGRPANILSGGEFPVLVPGGSLGQATIEWREFGVRMEAVPVVLGNGRLRLDVAPEVSERDFSSAVTVGGLVVPGITTRRVNTQVEMRFGETLMIGGLISTRKSGEANKLPFLGELPFIGAAFRAVRHDESETELMILVTPYMVAPMQPHQVPHQGPGQFTDDPTDRELYLDGMLEVPLYGPECEGCDALGGYGGGGFIGGGGYGGEACLTPTPASGGMMLPANNAYNTPVNSYPQPQPYPPSTTYEQMPSQAMPQSQPYYSEPPLPPAGMPMDNGPVSTPQQPVLPPLPGQAQTPAQPTSSSNRPANLGLIDPFRKQFRTSQVPVQTQSQRWSLEASATRSPVPSGSENRILQTSGLIKPRFNVIQAGSTLSAPAPARGATR